MKKNMNPIELTEEHKSKLLEMCNKLFPEYNQIVLTKQKFLNFGFKNYRSHTSRIGNMSIHWFEFLMSHLILKLYWNDYKQCEIFLMRCLFQSEQPHPIDYLYEEFKKKINSLIGKE